MFPLDGRPYKECFAWGRRMIARIAAEKPDVVILGQMRPFSNGQQDVAAITDAVETLWRRLQASGVKVIAIADTPRWKADPDDCMAATTTCSVRLERMINDPDPIVEALGACRRFRCSTSPACSARRSAAPP